MRLPIPAEGPSLVRAVRHLAYRKLGEAARVRSNAVGRARRRTGFYAVAPLLALWTDGCMAQVSAPSDRSLILDTRPDAAVWPGELQAGEAVGCLNPEVPALLTLRDALRIARRCNPLLAEAVANVASQRAKLASTRSAYNPTLSMTDSATAGIGGAHVYGEPVAPIEDTANTSASLQLNWVLYDFGLRKAKIADGVAQVRATLADERVATFKLISDVIQSYFALVSADGQVKVAVAAHRVSEETVASLEKKLSNGLARRTEVLQARSDAAKTAAQTMKKRAALLEQMADLASRMGLSVDTQVTLPPSVDNPVIRGAPQPFSIRDFYTILGTVPAVQAANERYQSARAKLDAARLSSRGTISAAINSNRTSQLHSFVGEAITPRADTIQLTINVPVFEGGARQAQIADAIAALRAAEATLRSAAGDAMLAAWKANLELNATQSAISAASALLDATHAEALRLSAGYGIGDASILDVLQARASEVEAEQELVQAKADSLAAAAQLQLSLGREIE
jgi:outer membrane protein